MLHAHDDDREQKMNAHLRLFAAQWLGVALMTLAPVVLVTFLTVPMALGRHPGEPAPNGEPTQWHMT
jgi:hypothetical protein